jgi:ABC-type nitrate/sulfonate/bicarbonate transport system substrate-binding protein
MDARKKITFGVSSDFLQLCFAAAFLQGAISSEELEVATPEGEKDILKGILDRSLDMGRVASIEAIKANVQGKPVYTVACFENRMIHVILGSRSIHSPGELRNRRVGVNSSGDYTDQYMRAALRYLGLAPDKDVEIVPAGQSPERRRQLAADEIQATIVSQAPALKLRQDGFPWLAEMADVFPNYVNKVIVAHEAIISQNPAGVTGVIKAIIQGHRFLENAENDEEIKRMIKTLNAKNPSLVMAQLSVWRTWKPLYTGSVTMEGFQVVLEEAKKKVDIPPGYDLSQLLRLSPLAEAQRELGIDG